MVDLCGLTIEHYLLERQIGAGGVAQVYYGRNYRTLEAVAVKIAHPRLAQDAAFRALFLREAEINGRLHHPDILPIHFAGEWEIDDLEQPLPYLIAPHISGGSVAAVRRRYAHQQQAIPIHAAIGCVLRVADALHAAHEHGEFHLDIKPENLLLRYESNLTSVIVADFGASAGLLREDGVQIRSGTPAYMAPEQFAGLPPDGRSDQYALAVVLFELVTGRRPFPADTAAAIYTQQSQPPMWTDVPAGLVLILQRALAFDPTHRFFSVREFADALRDWQQTAVTQSGTIPQSVDTTETRLQAEQWLPPVTQMRAIDYEQRWIGGAYRFFIAHQNGHMHMKTVAKETRVIEIGRIPGFGQGWQDGEVGQIVLPDSHISERHATLERAGDGWQVLDKGSRNGTFLNGERLAINLPQYWRGRIPLRIGPYLLVWEAQDKFGLTDEQAHHAYRQDESKWNRLIRGQQFWVMPQSEQTVSVSIDPAPHLAIKPGETAELTVTLTTQTAVVERVELRLEGIPSYWYTIPTVDATPVAGVPQTMLIIFHPPPDQAGAGQHIGELILFSPIRYQEQYRQKITLDVLPVSGQLADLHPKHLHGSGEARVTIWNTGNHDDTYWVIARDPADAMQFTPARDQVTVPAKQQTQHLVQVVPVERRPFLPPAKRLPYEIQVGRTQTELKTINGRLELKPIFPGWLLIVIPLLAVLLYFAVPAIISRSAARRDMRQQAAALEVEASATAVSAQATIIVSQDLLAGIGPEAAGTLPPELAAVAAAQTEAEADLAAANAQADQADAIEEMANNTPPIGPALPPAAPPTAILLDNNSIAEDAPSGTVIGLLSAEDANEDETHLYSLVSGDGDADNGLVTIEGGQLKLLGMLDFETQPELSLRVQAQDSRGQTLAQRLKVLVTDANEPFTAVALSKNSVAENELSAFIGELTAVDDPDTGDSHTFAIVADPSGKLEISGPTLRVKSGESMNYEMWTEGLEITVKAEDGGGAVVTQTLPLMVEDQNDLPVVNDFGVEVNEDDEVTIPTAKFVDNFTDEDTDDNLRLIKITTLPEVGQFKLDDEFVFAGQELSVSPNSLMTFIPGRNFNGHLSFQWEASDGSDFSAEPATTTITVIPVPDPASFVPETDQYTVEEDAGSQNFNWAVDIRHPDGDPRDLRFVICSNSKPALFSSGPRVSLGGNLIFTPAPDKNGRADLDIVLVDQAELGKGDAETTATVCAAHPQTRITINVEPVNDAPVVSNNSACTAIDLGTYAEGDYPGIEVKEMIDLLPDGCLRDVDGRVFRSIAVVGLDPDAGAWLYRSVDDGIDSWQTFPAQVADTAAVLLRGSAEISVTQNFSNTATLTFRAWDRTIGQSGSTDFDIQETGNESAFSSRVVTATITLTGVNNAPLITLPAGSVSCEVLFIAEVGAGAAISDPDDLGDGRFHFNGGSLLVELETQLVAPEVIRIEPGGTAQAGIDINENTSTIYFNGNLIGEWSQTNRGINIQFTTDNATTLAVTTLLQRIVYDGQRCSPFASNPDFNITITFDDGGNSGTGSSTFDVKNIVIKPY